MGGIGDFFGGVWEGLKGIADTLVMLGELSMIRMLIDPDGWARDVRELASGLWWGITHPIEFFKVAIDWETWKTNPLRAFGKLIPDLAIAAATAGTGTAATAAGRGARAADLATDAAEAARTADRLADGADAGRTADRLGDAAQTRLPDPGEWPRLPDPDTRPSWQDSERAVEDLYGPHGYEPQRSFKDGDEVPYGTEGSTRPELYREGTSIEVKNYNCETAGGRHRLQENLVEQATHRRDMLPEGTVQHVIVDVRGQTLNLQHLVALAERIELKSGGAVLAENIQFIR